MSDVSSEIYSHYREAALRFNYFLTGASGAICAFLVQQWEPSPIGLDSKTLELGAILFVGLSTVFSFINLEREVIFLGNAVKQEGIKVDLEQCYDEKHKAIHLKNINFLQDINNGINSSMMFCYRIKNLLLLLGCMAYLIAKVLTAYNL